MWGTIWMLKMVETINNGLNECWKQGSQANRLCFSCCLQFVPSIHLPCTAHKMYLNMLVPTGFQFQHWVAKHLWKDTPRHYPPLPSTPPPPLPSFSSHTILPSLQLSQAGKTWQTSKSSLSRRNHIRHEWIPLQGPSEYIDVHKHGPFLLSDCPKLHIYFYV